MAKRVMRVLSWSFVAAAIAGLALRTLIDPLDLRLLSRWLGMSETALLTASVLALWLLAAGVGALICFVRRAPAAA